MTWFRENITSYDFPMQQVYIIGGLSRQGYHQQVKREQEKTNMQSKIINLVKQERKKHPRMGARNLFLNLNLTGIIGVNRFENLLVSSGLGVPRKRSVCITTDSNHNLHKYTNLLHGYKLTGVNQVWATDITYFRIGEKNYYISFIQDIFSRRILGYTVSDNMRKENNLRVLEASIKERDGIDFSKLIHHSDKGSQFCSNAYIKKLKKFKINISMADTSLENAYVERLNGILKNDYLYPRNKAYNLKSLKAELKEVVRLYNEERPHSALGGLTPCQFEKQLIKSPDSLKMAMELYDFEKNKYNRFFEAYTIEMEKGLLTKNTLASNIHSHRLDYPLKSCSSAELSSVSSNEVNIKKIISEKDKSFQQ